jgi:hypothetical protein
MADHTANALTREERQLIQFYRNLPTNEQLDILGTAEASFNASQRMKELADRKVETNPPEEKQGWH